VRIAQERMLSMLRDNLKEGAKKQKERKMAKQYKMVKFFGKEICLIAHVITLCQGKA
jgi:hypothetical protein